MEEKTYKCMRETLDSYCNKCLWYDDCLASDEDDEQWTDTCDYFTSYTDSTSDELDEDERSYFDELTYRQRAYAAIIYSMREE